LYSSARFINGFYTALTEHIYSATMRKR
jgi:hypothetical protein